VALHFLVHVDVPNMHSDEMTAENEVLMKRYRLGLYLQLLERESDLICVVGIVPF